MLCQALEAVRSLSYTEERSTPDCGGNPLPPPPLRHSDTARPLRHLVAYLCGHVYGVGLAETPLTPLLILTPKPFQTTVAVRRLAAAASTPRRRGEGGGPAPPLAMRGGLRP